MLELVFAGLLGALIATYMLQRFFPHRHDLDEIDRRFVRHCIKNAKKAPATDMQSKEFDIHFCGKTPDGNTVTGILRVKTACGEVFSSFEELCEIEHRENQDKLQQRSLAAHKKMISSLNGQPVYLFVSKNTN